MWGYLLSLNPNVPSIDLINTIILDKRQKPITDSTTQRNKLSSPHCKIYLLNNNPTIEDLSSRNGTFVNGNKLESNNPLTLKNNDNITLAIPSILHVNYDKNRHFAFTFQIKKQEEKIPISSNSKRKQRAPSKFDIKKKVVTSKRGISVVSGTGRTFTKTLESPEDYAGQLRFKPGSSILDKLQTAIKENNSEWLQSFIEIGGLNTILRELELRLKKSQLNNLDKLICYHAVKVINQIMQQEEGFDAILDTRNALGIISLGLASDSVKLQTLIPMLLAAVACISQKGHLEVINAMNYYQKEKNERVRFKRLVTSLKTEDDIEYKTNVLRLINAIISKHDNIEQRTTMRQEFKQLGLLDIMEGLRYDDDRDLNIEIDGFFDEMEEDSKESMVNNVDLSDPVAIATALVTQTHGKALEYYTEIMQQLFSIPVGGIEAIGTWRLVEDVVRSATATETTTSKTVSKKLDFQTIRKMKKSPQPDNLLEQDQIAMRKELESLREEIKQLNIKHLQQVNELVDKYSNDKKDLQKSLESEIASLRDRLEEAQKNIPEKLIIPKEQVKQEEKTTNIPIPPPVINTPPPPPGLVPPPPPGIGGGRTNYSSEYPCRPSVQMKKFYWQNIRERDITDTIWESVNFTNVNYLEPIELEKLFGAKKKAEIKEKIKNIEDENPYQNMIDLKRSNNIGIMLKHFKLSPTALKKAIIELDENILTSEKISQLYRNAPTPEEIELLSSFNGDIRDLGKSEQFLYHMVSIPDISERLELLYFRSNFEDESEDLKHHYKTVIKGIEQVLQSTKLDNICELILAIGNFMNYGQWKAPSVGFKIEFLTKVADTRTTDNTLNMMHYITGLIADKKPEYLDINNELSMVGNASRIPVSKLNTDVSKMNNTMTQIKRLLKKEDDETMERFREVMLSFSINAKRELEIIGDLKTELQSLTTKLQKYYPFASSLPIEESLGIISEFLLLFMKCHNDNEQEQANREMKERMAKKRKEREEAQALKKKNRTSKPKSGLMDGAMATIRGGGMKTFRAKRGKPMLQSMEALQAAMNANANPKNNTISDVIPQPIEQESQTINDTPTPIENINTPPTSITKSQQLNTIHGEDSASFLEDMLANNEL